MVFINTGSRRDVNPYSSSSRGGSSLLSKMLGAVTPKVLGALSLIVALWLVAIIALVRENPEIKREVLSDIQREERLIQGKIRRGRMRAKEWLRHRLDEGDEGPAPATKQTQHEWDLTPLEDLALRTGPDDTPIHVVFSTDCSPYQHWQAYQFFLGALRIRQPGRITQIASGCTSDEEKKSIRAWHEEHIAPLSLRFGLHLTPHFSSVKDASGKTVEYEFFNKPFGLKHWMEFGEGMGIDPTTQQPWKHDTIIALLDPDQVLIKPITGYVSTPDDIFRGGSMTDGSVENEDSLLSFAENEPHFLVRHGHPLAQEYGFRDAWRKYASVAGSDSPATMVTSTEAMRSYAVGPPYVATALDMYTIAVGWCEFVPKVHARFPQLLAEMYAYSISAAHNALPHQLMASYMVSDTIEDKKGGEGWKYIDDLPGDEVCPFALNNLDADVHPLPSVLHLCHRYGVGDRAFFAKKKLPKNFFSCESALLEEPAMDIGSGKYLYKKPPFLDKKVEYSAVVEKREAFMVCAATGFLNEVALYFKNRHCGNDANLKKTISLHDLPE